MTPVKTSNPEPIRLTIPPATLAHAVDAAALFANNRLLKGIGPAVLNEIAPRLEILDLTDGTIVFDEGQPGDALYLIASGSVKISKLGRGGQQETLTFLHENDYFGEMALVDSAPRSAQARVIGQAKLARMDRAIWDLLLHFSPSEVMGNFTHTISQRLRQNNDHFIEEMKRSERLSLLGTTISSIVHDMNNPITTILGACQVIQSSAQDEVTTQMSGLIREAVDRMETMTRELLDFSRGNTELRLKLMKVGDLVAQLHSEFNKCKVAATVKLDLQYAGPVRIDRHRILRVFGNLIKNAREAMKPGKPNVLTFSSFQHEGGLRFAVSDTGHGIPADVLPKIFEPFMTHGKHNGTGLGLAISKAVINAHGGKISVTSGEKGTTFFVDLPLPQNVE